MHLIWANCFPPPAVSGDLLVGDEPLVAEDARARGLPTASPEATGDAALRHVTSQELWRMARVWFEHGGNDLTRVHGISAGDLAGLEAAINVLGAAARGALAMVELLRDRPPPEVIECVVPHDTASGAAYDRWETMTAAAAVHAARHLCGPDLVVRYAASTDPRNEPLRDKYARTRNPDFLLPDTAVRRARRLAQALAERVALLRRPSGPALAVVEYNPTVPYSRAYAAGPEPRRRLIRFGDPREIPAAIRAGDIVQSMPPARRDRSRHEAAGRLAALGDELLGATFTVAGVPMWPVVRDSLLDLVSRYAHYAQTAVPFVVDGFRRWGVDGVLVPYDNDPATRVLVRVAQSMQIPTFSINDGYKGDDIQVEGMSTDVALAWTQGTADRYFSRHPGGTVVTGNPRFDGRAHTPYRAPGPGPLRVLVGSHTFSAIDLNSRRCDPERFLSEVLEGCRRTGQVSEIVVKLHPADAEAHYRHVLSDLAGPTVTIRAGGDIVELFTECDVYITTASTSLLEAALELPVIYYRVNEQRLHPPFSDDAYLGARTAASADELAVRLSDRAALSSAPPVGWSTTYLGPNGACDRITATLEDVIGRLPATRAARANG